MKETLTIVVFCSDADADHFVQLGFETVMGRSDAVVSLLHQSAGRKHAASLVTLALAGVPFYGYDDGGDDAAPSLFAAADGAISFAMRIPGYDEPAVFVAQHGRARDVERAVAYWNRFHRAKQLIAERPAVGFSGLLLIN